jgi:hypothetical protein
MLYVFVVIEHGTRRLAHINVTVNPTADWTLQQLREVVVNGGGHRYLIHDRDQIVAKQLDDSIRALGIHVLRSTVVSPKANTIKGRPHSALGPGVRDPRRNLKLSRSQKKRHRVAAGALVLVKSCSRISGIVGGLKDECLNRMILLVRHRRAAPLVIALSIITKSAIIRVSQIA